MKKVLVTGSNGQLVTDLIEHLNNTGNYNLECFDREGCDVTDYDKLGELFSTQTRHLYSWTFCS